MKVKVLKMYKDKNTKILHKADEEIEITEERYKELITSPLGVFVAEIKEEPPAQPPADKNPEDPPKEPEEPTEPPIDDGKIDSIAFTKMKKEDVVKYAKEVMNIELGMEMKKDEMIEILSR